MKMQPTKRSIMGAIVLGLLTLWVAPDGERVFADGGDAVTIWNENAGDRGDRGVPRTPRQPAPRIAHLRDDAHRHPRCAQCDRPPLSAVRLRRAGGAGRFS